MLLLINPRKKFTNLNAEVTENSGEISDKFIYYLKIAQ